jgi:hypothetical protein
MLDLQLMKSAPLQPMSTRIDLAGSLPYFPGHAGSTLATSLPLPGFGNKRLIFGQFTTPGQAHVFSADCRAGERLRVQMLAPVLAGGGGLAPAFAVVAQSLPYSADVRKLPFDLPAGFSAVVAPPPGELMTPAQDLLTGARYYPGPVVDTRTLVGGRCYVVVWSPQNQMGKYVLQIGYGWPLRWGYWLQVPRYWWQIRGWFGLSRMAAYGALALAGGLAITALVWTRKRERAEGNP